MGSGATSVTIFSGSGHKITASTAVSSVVTWGPSVVRPLRGPALASVESPPNGLDGSSTEKSRITAAQAARNRVCRR